MIDSSAPLLVENLVDLEGPPDQMEYVNSYKVLVPVLVGGKKYVYVLIEELRVLSGGPVASPTA